MELAPSYTPAQFENSLGKLQCVTVKAPRLMLDVGVVRSQDPEPHPAPAQADSPGPAWRRSCRTGGRPGSTSCC